LNESEHACTLLARELLLDVVHGCEGATVSLGAGCDAGGLLSGELVRAEVGHALLKALLVNRHCHLYEHRLHHFLLVVLLCTAVASSSSERHYFTFL